MATPRNQLERELQGSHSDNDPAFENAAVGIAHVALNGRWLRVNKALAEMLGYSVDQFPEKSFLSVTHPDDHDVDLEFANQLLRGEIEQYAREKRYRRSDGTYIWASLTAGLKRDAEGRPDLFISVIEDISDRKLAEIEKAYLIEELAHRSRNLLTVFSSLISLLAPSCDSVPEFEERLLNRVHAISLSNDQLLLGEKDAASLTGLVHSQIRAFLGQDLSRVTVTGPDLRISARCAQALSLALYELTSNAFKHGALKAPDGRIAVTWTTSGTGEDAQFRFVWREISAAPQAPSGRRGFGTTVLETMSPMSVRGRAERTFEAEGIVWTLEAPFSAVVVQA